MSSVGKVALVTGAARGQGRTSALALAAAGADVALLDLCQAVESTPYGGATPDQLAQTADEVRALGRKASVLEVDARDLAAVAEGVERAEGELGPIEMAVINHGIWSRAPLFEMSEFQWGEMIDINLTSVWKVLRSVAPGMIERKRGAIVLVSSVAGLIGVPDSAHYAAAKHGVIGLMKTAALELGPRGIRVNAVCPGLVDTPMTDWQGCYDMATGHEHSTRADYEDAAQHFNMTGGLQRPEEVSAVVAWLLSDAASQITGVALPVDGGNTVLPGYNHGPFHFPTRHRG